MLLRTISEKHLWDVVASKKFLITLESYCFLVLWISAVFIENRGLDEIL